MSTPDATNRVADAPRRNWVDRFAPAAVLPYCHLARLDRPIGTWLLFWPCWWSLALAAHWQGNGLPDIWLMVLFGIGAITMRGCGCTYNDLVDREYDGRVARTRSRPIPSGRVSVFQAKAFLVFQALVGLAVLLQFNWFAVVLGAASLLVVAVYPFMKRITYWPQFVLGLAFNWGALLGWAVVTGGLHPAPVVLYIAGIAWTLGYDTIYAHQDKEDDALIGLKSSALKLGDRTTKMADGFLQGGDYRDRPRRLACRRRRGVLHRRDRGRGPCRLANRDARHQRSRPLPQAVPLEPGFRLHRLRRHRGGCPGAARLVRPAPAPAPYRPMPSCAGVTRASA